MLGQTFRVEILFFSPSSKWIVSCPFIHLFKTVYISISVKIKEGTQNIILKSPFLNAVKIDMKAFSESQWRINLSMPDEYTWVWKQGWAIPCDFLKKSQTLASFSPCINFHPAGHGKIMGGSGRGKHGLMSGSDFLLLNIPNPNCILFSKTGAIENYFKTIWNVNYPIWWVVLSCGFLYI